MRRFYAVLCAVVCLAVAVTLWAEEPKKKGKWYDIFRGPPTVASQEHQLRRERFELHRQRVQAELFQKEKQFDLTMDLIDELDARITTNRRHVLLLAEAIRKLQSTIEQTSDASSEEWIWDAETNQWVSSASVSPENTEIRKVRKRDTGEVVSIRMREGSSELEVYKAADRAFEALDQE